MKKIFRSLLIFLIVSVVFYGILQLNDIWKAAALIILINEIQISRAVRFICDQFSKGHKNVIENQIQAYRDLKSLIRKR